MAARMREIFLGTVRQVVCNPLFDKAELVVVDRSVACVPSVVPKLDDRLENIVLVTERTEAGRA